MALAHANRVATMGQLSASIAHEVKQPITAAVTYALAARRWLSAEPRNFHEVALWHIPSFHCRAATALLKRKADFNFDASDYRVYEYTAWLLIKHAFPAQCAFESLGGLADQEGVVIGALDRSLRGDP
jgi:hypothetical protein